MRFILIFMVIITSVASSNTIPLPVINAEPASQTNLTLESVYKLALHNTDSEMVAFDLKILNNEGQLQATTSISLEPNAQTTLNLSETFPQIERTKMAQVQFQADEIKAILIAGDNSTTRLAGVWPAPATTEDRLLVTHVATDRNQFFTAFSLHSNQTAELLWMNDQAGGAINLGTFSANSTHLFEVGDFYLENQIDASLHEINTQTNSAALSGIQSFGAWDGSKRLALLPLSFSVNRRLVFPHIATDLVHFWTGIVAGNPSSESIHIDCRFFNMDGTILDSQFIQVPPQERWVLLFDNLPETAESNIPMDRPIPAGTAWVEMKADQPLAGFELFGSAGDTMEAIRASGMPWREGSIPYIHHEPDGWSGIALVNAVALESQVTLELYDASGNKLATINIDLAPYSKLITEIETLFGPEITLQGASIRVKSEGGEGLYGLVLFGDRSEPRQVLGGYEMIPISGETPGATPGIAGLPRLGVNFPAFHAAPGVTVPNQEALQGEMAWWASGHPGRVSTRQMQDRDVFFSSWDRNNAELWNNRLEWLQNDQGFGVMPTLIGQGDVEWSSAADPVHQEINLSNPDERQQLIDYVTDVVITLPHLRYFEVLNEVIIHYAGSENLQSKRDNFAEILRVTAKTAKSINPDLLISYPHFLGTIPEQVEGACEKAQQLEQDYPDIPGLYDVFGLHYYGPWQEFMQQVRQSFLARMENGSLSTKPWMLSETGISNSNAEDTVSAINNIEGDQRRQASYVVKIPVMGYALGAENVLIHTVQSGSVTGGWAGFGLIDAQGGRTLASCTLRLMISQITDFTSIDVLSEGQDDLWMFLFRDGAGPGRHRIICWGPDYTNKTVTLQLPSEFEQSSVTIRGLIPNTCPGTAGDGTLFNADELFSITLETINADGSLTLQIGEEPIILEINSEKTLTETPQQKVTAVQKENTYPVQVTRDLVYGQGLRRSSWASTSSEVMDLTLDLYEPMGGPEGLRPAIVMIHGGGFVSGSKEHAVLSYFAETFASRGWVCCSINYRLAEAHGNIPQNWPQTSPSVALSDDQLKALYPAGRDVKAVLRWLHANAGSLSIHPDYIAAIGGSAGSFLAVMLGIANPNDYTDEIPVEDDRTLSSTNLNARSDVKTVIDHWGGPLLLTILEGLDGENRFNQGDASISIVHGESDPVVPFTSATDLKSRCEDASIPVGWYPFDGSHAEWGVTINDQSLLDLAFNFITQDQTLKVE